MSYADPPAAKIDYEAWNAAFGRAPGSFPRPAAESNRVRTI